MLASTIDGFVKHITDHITGFSSNNCKGYDDEAVFDYILRTSLSPNPQQGCIVSYGGVEQNRQSGEFGGLIVNWTIIVSGIFPLSGDLTDMQTQKKNAYDFIDDLLGIVIADPTLGNTVMDCVILDGEQMMEYVRNGVNTFILVSMRFTVTENL